MGECSILTRADSIRGRYGDRRVQLQLPPEKLIEIVRTIIE